MFYYLSGAVSYLESNIAVIDCGGVGYLCNTTSYTTSSLKIGINAKLYTYLNVREDAMDLFGFATLKELNIFKLLISVSGVGPKAALSILSCTTPDSLTLSIATEDENALTAAPGIGKKTAQRVILELKDKMMNTEFGALESTQTITSATKTKLHDVNAALSLLGYSTNEINTAIKEIDVNKGSLESIIRQALKNLAK